LPSSSGTFLNSDGLLDFGSVISLELLKPLFFEKNFFKGFNLSTQGLMGSEDFALRLLINRWSSGENGFGISGIVIPKLLA
jgi:hypothetical protein